MREKILTFILKICAILPFVLLAVSLVAYVFLIATGRSSIAFKGSIILLPLTLISIFLIINRKKIFSGEIKLCDEVWLETKFNHRIITKLYIVLFCIALIWILLTGTRNLVFLVLTALLYLLPVIQIFLKKHGKAHIILLEFMATFALQAFSTVFSHAYYYGWTDVILHLNYVQTVLNCGYVTDILGKYANYSLFHIDTVICTLTSGLSPYISMYLTAIPITVISIVFIWGFTKFFVKSDKISLLAGFFYLMVPMVLYTAQYPMPRIHATIAFIIILYLIFKEQEKFSVSVLLLTILICGYMILVHHAQIIPIILMMTGILTFYIIYKHKTTVLQKMQIGFFYLFSIIGIAIGPYGTSWLKNKLAVYFPQLAETIEEAVTIPTIPMPVSPGINDNNGLTNTDGVIDPDEIEDIIEDFESLGGADSAGDLISSSASERVLDPINQFLFGGDLGIGYWFNCAATSIMLIFIIFGIYYLLSPNLINKKVAVFGFIGLLLTIIFAQGVFDVIQNLANIDLELDRLRLVMAPAFAIIMAVGCNVIANLKKTEKQPKHKKGSIVVLILCGLLIISSPIINESRDSTVFNGLIIQNNAYFTETEITSFDTVDLYLPVNTKIDTDFPVYRVFPASKRYQNYDMKYYSLPLNAAELFSTDTGINKKVQAIIWREEQYKSLEGITLFSGSKNEKNHVYCTETNTQIFNKNTYSFNPIYSSGSVILLKR